ncbi:MAG: reverse transcriptase domain-containing protein, partial [Candidatus Aerophobetes bacterium]|nr:reverse transcriptase domain-containing protein [Candidatus Aerophobetes bacterium]
QRIKDPNFLRLIGRFLKVGVVEEGKLIHFEEGTPQGAVLSPVLANIYLHFCLDLWFEKIIKKEAKGFVQLNRYADDFIALFQSSKEAEEFGRRLRQRLSKFGLKIAEEKSRIIPFGRYVWHRAQKEAKELDTFDFLGFTHYCDKTRGGKFKLGRKTTSKKFRQKAKQMNQWLKSVRNQVKLRKWWKLLEIKLIGHYRYYGISGNMPAMRAFYTLTFRLAHKWINRRSQKRSYNWRQFQNFVKYNPLPLPKIYHLTYTLSSH